MVSLPARKILTDQYNGSERNLTSNETNNGPTTNLGISEEDRRKYLQELQAQTTLAMIPAMIFVILMAVIGVIGNSLVLYVYSRKFVLNGTRVFILVIAAFDLMTDAVGIPEEIYRMLHMWDFNQPWLCKLFASTNIVTTMVSAKMLVALAVARYRKVCVTSGWQISTRQAKIVAAVLIFTSFLFSAPSVIINGLFTRRSPRPDISGCECFVDDAYVKTKWPLAFCVFLIILFIACCSAMVGLHIRVGAKVWRHSRNIRLKKCTYSPDGSSSSDGIGALCSTSTSMGVTAKEKLSKQGGATSDATLDSFMKTSTWPKSDTHSNKEELDKMCTLHEKDKYTQEVEKDHGKDPENVTDASNQAGGIGIVVDHSTHKEELHLCTVHELTTNLGGDQKQESREDHEEQSKQLETIGENTGEASRKEELEKEERLQNKGMGTIQPIGVKNRTKTVHFQMSEPFKEENKPKGSENNRNNETAEDAGMVEAIHSCRGGVQSEEQQSTTGIILRSQDCNANKNDPQATDSDKHCKVSKSGLSEEAKVNGHAIKSYAHFGNREEEPKIKFIRDMKMEKKPLESDAEAQKVTPNEGMILRLNSTSCNHEVPQGDNFLYKVLNCMKMSSDTSSQPCRKSKNMKQRKTSCYATTPRDLTKDDENNHSRTDLSETGKRNLKRTMIMLITISVIYIVEFIPYLALVSYYFAMPEARTALSGKDLAIYNLFVRFPFLNTAANFVIYCYCDLAFRRKCMSVIRQIFLCTRS